MKRLAFLLVVLPISVWPQATPAEPSLPTLHERFEYYVHRTYTSRERLAYLVADSALDHLHKDPKEWGRDPETFGVRLASNFGRRVVSNSIEFGLGALLNEDARYFPLEHGPWRQRIWHATTGAFTARGPGGTTRFGFSRLGATAGSLLIASTWQPRVCSPSERVEGIAFAMVGRVPDNLLSEFSPDLRRTGKRVVRAVWPDRDRKLVRAQPALPTR